MIVTLDRKARLANEIAAARGLRPASVSRLLVLGDTATSRRRVAQFAALFDAAFPRRAAEIRAWLRTPGEAMSGLLFLSYAVTSGRSSPPASLQRVRASKRPPMHAK